MEIKFELDDPVTRDAIALARVLASRIEYIVNIREDIYSQYKAAVNELSHFAEAMIRPRMNSDQLGLLLDHYGGVFELMESAGRFFKVKVERYGSPANYGKREREAVALPRMFEAVRAKLESLTPAQVMVQRHLKLFAYHDFTWEEPTAEAAQMLAPLAVLRDRYFLRPEPQVLLEYLACADAIDRTDTYDLQIVMFNHQREAQQAELSDLALELEVLAMVESTYSGDGEGDSHGTVTQR
jgi:hypothetical protein